MKRCNRAGHRGLLVVSACGVLMAAQTASAQVAPQLPAAADPGVIQERSRDIERRLREERERRPDDAPAIDDEALKPAPARPAPAGVRFQLKRVDFTRSELLPEATLQRLMLESPGANPSRMKRLALAAIRETFEETGIVIGRTATSLPSLSGPWGEFAGTGHLPDLSGLAYIARAITPPRRPKRFDTRFFVVESAAIAHQVPDVVTADSELTELAWLTLPETEKLPLPVITRVMLGELQGWLAARASGIELAIPFYRERHGRMERNLI